MSPGTRIHLRDEQLRGAEGSVTGYSQGSGRHAIPSAACFDWRALLQVETSPPNLTTPDAEGTYFYARPKRPTKMSGFKARGARLDDSSRARRDHPDWPRGDDVTASMNRSVPGERPLAASDGQMTISDLVRKNGTFRIAARTSFHGDYVFLVRSLCA